MQAKFFLYTRTGGHVPRRIFAPAAAQALAIAQPYLVACGTSIQQQLILKELKLP